MTEWIKKIDEKLIVGLAKFLKSFVYPFATCFFAILNYAKMRDILLKRNHPNWAFFCLILSAVYVAFTLGFGIYWLILAIRGIEV